MSSVQLWHHLAHLWQVMFCMLPSHCIWASSIVCGLEMAFALLLAELPLPQSRPWAQSSVSLLKPCNAYVHGLDFASLAARHAPGAACSEAHCLVLRCVGYQKMAKRALSSLLLRHQDSRTASCSKCWQLYRAGQAANALVL